VRHWYERLRILREGGRVCESILHDAPDSFCMLVRGSVVSVIVGVGWAIRCDRHRL
jgi:hypothetical protein